MEKKYFLHELLKNTNFQMPAIGSVDYNKFPTQDSNKVNQISSIKFIKQGYIPKDFETYAREQDEHPDRDFEKEFITIRSDKDDYFDSKQIYLSMDCEDIIIIQKDKNQTFYSCMEDNEHLIGLRVYPEYTDRLLEREAYLFSIQGLENGFATIIEYLDDRTYRIVLDTELFYEYNPDDIYVPVEEPDVASIRKRLIEGRVAYRGENNVER